MFYLQIIDTLTSSTGAITMEENTNLLELVLKGGWLLIPIGILSVLAIYIFVERFFTIKKAGTIDPNFMNNIRDYVANENMMAAETLCKNSTTPTAKMIEKGISRVGRPLNDISTAIENVGKLEVAKLEKGLASLATIAGAAPMIGFLGTVLGMIKAFFNMSKAGNNIDPGVLAGGIYEAMITTAAGLAVGIIAYVGYNVLVSMVDKAINKMEAISVEFIDLLHD